ncbi:thioredoxin domain-containing protein [Cryobacterium roopkundense]|uniref:Protein-disulfide isomerase n=1 Tax=Cryobacterium roopkundense TaxID=1001240 RepID=A0A7W8ZWA2_9MICO|nr:thioredoxin domain-containing protein [Cryobacterium roopkundense]MBB5641369.1 protein-disulfide isomerase [Cryobacterium roopkundense]
MTSTAPDQQEPAFAQAPKTNSLAIVALASSFFIGVVGIVTGYIALGQIKARGESGRGIALAGVIIGWVQTAIVALVIVLIITFAATIGGLFAANNSASQPGSVGDSQTAAPLPTGQVGTADFDAGFLTVGTGPVTVDVYFDPMCPYCQQFEEANGPSLALAATNGAITLRLHSLTFLDRLSAGTDYSTRASSALTCEATLNPTSTLDYLAALFANQPAENSAGLSDDELVSLSTGSESIAECVADGEYATWSQANTEQATTGPIPGSDLPAISGTPTVLVDGVPYEGSLTDSVEFAQFVAAAFDR